LKSILKKFFWKELQNHHPQYPQCNCYSETSSPFSHCTSYLTSTSSRVINFILKKKYAGFLFFLVYCIINNYHSDNLAHLTRVYFLDLLQLETFYTTFYVINDYNTSSSIQIESLEPKFLPNQYLSLRKEVKLINPITTTSVFWHRFKIWCKDGNVIQHRVCLSARQRLRFKETIKNVCLVKVVTSVFKTWDPLKKHRNAVRGDARCTYFAGTVHFC